MRLYLRIWICQMLAQLGAATTSFALGIWVFSREGSISNFSLILLCAEVPGMALSPITGTIADKGNVRHILLWCSVAIGLCSMALLFLATSKFLSLPPVCIIVCFIGIFKSLQWSGFTAAAGGMFPDGKSSLVASLSQLGEASPLLLAPLVGGLLMAHYSVEIVLLFDISLILLSTIGLVQIKGLVPRRVNFSQESLRANFSSGFIYIFSLPFLRRRVAWLIFMNFITGLGIALMTPMVLSRYSPKDLGSINASSGLGILLGGAMFGLVSLRFTPRKLIPVGSLFSALGFALMSASDSVSQLAAASFISSTAMSFTGAAMNSIWLAEVPRELFGRVFSVRRMLTFSAIPIAYLVASPFVSVLQVAASSVFNVSLFASVFATLCLLRLIQTLLSARRGFL